MSYYKTKDGVSIYYKDWGKGQPVVFSHGWPLCADAWDDQMFYLTSKGYRTIAFDRRGHGRSEQPWDGYNYETYADDLEQLLEKLDLKNAILVGHSMGGGEIARYIGKYGTKRVAGVVLISAVTPGLLKTSKNPNGLEMSVFDGLRNNITQDRSQFFKDFSSAFFGANRSGSKVTQGIRDTFWYLGMQGCLKAQYDCIKAFSETEFTEDFKKFDIPTLFIHGDDDQIVPIEITALRAEKLVKGATLKVYKGGDHGLPTTFKTKINEDLLFFIQELASLKQKKAI